MGTNKNWIKYANKHLKGRTILEVRYMTDREQDNMNWNSKAIVMHLDNGSLLLPSRDDEGNDAGALFGQTEDGKSLTFPVIL